LELIRRLSGMRPLSVIIFFLAAIAFAFAQTTDLKTADAVLERYKTALGGVEKIKKVQSLTVHGEAEAFGVAGKAPFTYHAKPFKILFKVTQPDGTEVI
jgi:hypothetical protein